MSAPLSNKQKFILADLARQAWARCGPQDDGIEEDAFRHREVIKAVGKPGLTACSQSDYKIVQAHFLQLLGRDGEAFNSLVRHETNDRRVVASKLITACRAACVRLSYAEAICQSRYKCSLDDATVPQLWKIKFTIDARGRARRKSSSSSKFQPN